MRVFIGINCIVDIIVIHLDAMIFLIIFFYFVQDAESVWEETVPSEAVCPVVILNILIQSSDIKNSYLRFVLFVFNTQHN